MKGVEREQGRDKEIKVPEEEQEMSEAKGMTKSYSTSSMIDTVLARYIDLSVVLVVPPLQQSTPPTRSRQSIQLSTLPHRTRPQIIRLLSHMPTPPSLPITTIISTIKPSSSSSKPPHPNPKPQLRTPHFDPYNSSSTGHQRAENRLAGSPSWRDSRSYKLASQFSDKSGSGGGRLYDLVGAGSVHFGQDGRLENEGWERGPVGLRRGKQGGEMYRDVGEMMGRGLEAVRAKRAMGIGLGVKTARGREAKGGGEESDVEGIVDEGGRENKRRKTEDEEREARREMAEMMEKGWEALKAKRTRGIGPELKMAKGKERKADVEKFHVEGKAEERVGINKLRKVAVSDEVHREMMEMADRGYEAIKAKYKAKRARERAMQSEQDDHRKGDIEVEQEGPRGVALGGGEETEPKMNEEEAAVDVTAQKQPEIATPSSVTEKLPPQIFTNCTIYINGSTYPTISDHKLKHLLAQHGARVSLALGRRSVTHVIIGNPNDPRHGGPGSSRDGAGGGLSGSKIQKEIALVRGCGVKFVGVEWVLESVRVGKRVGEAGFAVVSTAPRGVGSVRGMFEKVKGRGEAVAEEGLKSG